jgi:uncharacterized membrane protein YbaN (DUF454 family)
LKKILLLSAGILCLILGGIGVFIPILPTTPFVLIAAGCFSAYPAVYKRIVKIRFFREYLESYKSGAPIHTSVRVKSLIALWLTLGLSMFLAGKVIMYIILPVVGVAVTVHLLTIGRGKGRLRQIEQSPSVNFDE